MDRRRPSRSAREAWKELTAEIGSKQEGGDIQHAVRTMFQHEDGIREALKARLHELGHIVDMSAQALSQELRMQPKLTEDCRWVSTEAADLGRQISRRMAELKAEVDIARRSRVVHSDSAAELPQERQSAASHEADMLRDEVQSLKLREQQLLSQVKMATSSKSGMGFDADLSAEIGRLNDEVTALRSERESWRSRALAAEARLALFPPSMSTGTVASDSNLHAHANRARRASSVSDDGLEREGERRQGGMVSSSHEVVESTASVGAQRQQVSGSAQARDSGMAIDSLTGAALESEDSWGGGWGSGGAAGRPSTVATGTGDSEAPGPGGPGALSILVNLSIPYAQVEEKARERSALKHTLVLDLLVALKDAGYTLRPGLVQVWSSIAYKHKCGDCLRQAPQHPYHLEADISCLHSRCRPSVRRGKSRREVV